VARRGLIAIASLTVVALGCKSAPACPVRTRTDPQETLAEHAARRQGWRSVKAEARVTQWADRGRIRGTVLMFLEQPGRVRFDVMTQLGPAAVLTSDGETFQLSDLRENAFVQGPTCPQNIARLLGIEVDAHNVLRLLTGDTPMIEASEQHMECRDGSYVVSLFAADGSKQDIEFSIDEGYREKPPADQHLTLRKSKVWAPDGRLQWEATYDDYTTVNGQSFPTNIRFVDRVLGADTEVRVKSISLNPDVPPDAFQQAPRPGMAVEVATCP
jgi:outer membrane lipoprotein-sorting protein